jgi:hypothetical protein
MLSLMSLVYNLKKCLVIFGQNLKVPVIVAWGAPSNLFMQ